MICSPEVLAVWREHGRAIVDGRAVVGHKFGRHGIAGRYGLTPRQARRLLALLRDHGPVPPAADDIGPPPGAGRVSLEIRDHHAIASGSVVTLDDLLSRCEVDRDAWRVASYQCRAWQAAAGGGEVRQLHYVRAALEPRRGVMLAPVVHSKFVPRDRPPASPSPLERVMLIPDAQVGHRRVRRGGREVLSPMHDRAAMSCAWEVATRAQPSTIILLGDMLDLTELTTRYPKPIAVLGTAQAAVVELAWWLRDLRERAPAARVLYIEGNHEHRLHRLTVERAASLEGLQAVDDDRPALSVARLLGLDALGIEYVGPYGEDMWLWPESASPVRVHHGAVVRTRGGATVAAQLAKQGGSASLVGGHVHRVEIAWRTTHGPAGRQSRFAMSPGCLCRIDGAVPGVTTRPDWLQGWGWIARDPERDRIYGATVPIMDGRTVYRGDVVDAAPSDELLATVRAGCGLDDLAAS